jgi:hypothetical protein
MDTGDPLASARVLIIDPELGISSHPASRKGEGYCSGHQNVPRNVVLPLGITISHSAAPRGRVGQVGCLRNRGLRRSGVNVAELVYHLSGEKRAPRDLASLFLPLQALLPHPDWQ